MCSQVSVCPQGVSGPLHAGIHPPGTRVRPPGARGRSPLDRHPPWDQRQAHRPRTRGRHPPWADTPLGPEAEMLPRTRGRLYSHPPPPTPRQSPHPGKQPPRPETDTPWADTPRPEADTPLHSACCDTVNKRAVRIPLECILVILKECSKVYAFNENYLVLISYILLIVAFLSDNRSKELENIPPLNTLNVLFTDDSVILSFTGGFAVRAKAMNGFLSMRVEVPSSVKDDPGDSGKLEGLLGNFNGDPSDDLTDWMDKQYSVSTMTDDQLYSYQDSCTWFSSKHLKKRNEQKLSRLCQSQ